MHIRSQHQLQALSFSSLLIVVTVIEPMAHVMSDEAYKIVSMTLTLKPGGACFGAAAVTCAGFWSTAKPPTGAASASAILYNNGVLSAASIVIEFVCVEIYNNAGRRPVCLVCF
jgi:hypothetical protein